MAMVSKLKVWRWTKGHTLETLEKQCGVPFWKISRIENGLLPSPEEVVKISQALEADPVDLFPVFDSSQWGEYLVAL